MISKPISILCLLILALGHAETNANERQSQSAIVSSPGDKRAIPRWDLQSSRHAGSDLTLISRPGQNVANWHHVEESRCTIMGCLLATDVYQDTNLWFSDNLRKFNATQFSVPWIYRNEFRLSPGTGRHFFVETHGITSKADIYFNGKQIADNALQSGSFGGHTYDITASVSTNNALAVRTFPANFNYDLVQGFVDWNPPAPDNGSGVWREIFIKATGPVSMGAVSITTHMKLPAGKSSANITVHTKAQNLEDSTVHLTVKSAILDATRLNRFITKATITLKPKETRLIELTHKIHSPQIWWPRQWGGQPLYKSELTFFVNSKVSDKAVQRFGIRAVTSKVNSHNDTIFSINGHPFQVIGGGYSPDQFFRWDRERFLAIARYTLDLGFNTIRLEGMMEHPELYEIADEMGIMIMAGWVCCSKWESWTYNKELQIDPVPYWVDNDYRTASASMLHEARMLQTHPSVLAYLVGSDFWPDDRATEIYVDALKLAHWQTPIIAAASKRGYPKLLGPSGLKMNGPYDWVPPNYWFDTEPSEDRLGAAFGFGSELGAGVGTPEYGSLRRFLSTSDMEDLWKRPDKDLFHMSTEKSSFKNRKIYNEGLFKRYGPPRSLNDYLLKAQMMDYEATRAQHEGFAARWNSNRPATGTIYWMLNNAWPSLHWNLFDNYLHPAGSYFGAKTGSRLEHVAYDYSDNGLWLINHSLDRKGLRNIDMELMSLDGKSMTRQNLRSRTQTNTASRVGTVDGLEKIVDVALLRLVLSDDQGTTLSRNVYWIGKELDELDWGNSTWYHTPVTKFADFTALERMKKASLIINSECLDYDIDDTSRFYTLELENDSDVPAFFIRLHLVDKNGEDVNPVLMSDNYMTLWPHEKMQIDINPPEDFDRGFVKVTGRNVEPFQLLL
ncbi:Exo-beta-D-glucosaminidase [Hirsutella minnesotensis 3608]|uniref:Exo-beta-D-glucosaminidase n=1 Tax=Hirsutella minnesotensis 3608 TaxID=1043627 RepID=A0A0F7ZTY3_9HYPO|nr:Exo-beta-D-glucosaminidase [Hirsutella minnesotensis 3608]